MIKKFCPYCDQEIGGGHYCKGCKRIVLHPYVQQVTYYLNERHSQSEESCQYHGDLHTGSMVRPETDASRYPGQSGMGSARKPGQSGTGMSRNSGQSQTDASRYPGLNRPGASRAGTAQGAEDSPMRRIQQELERSLAETKKPETARNTASGGTKRPGSGGRGVFGRLAPVIIIYVILTFGGVILRGISSFSGLEFLGSPDRTPEPDVIVEEETDWEEEETAEGERTAEDVRAAGIACNGYGHYDILLEEAGQVLEDTLSENEAASWGNLVSWEKTEYSYNYEVMDSSWYNTEREYDVYLDDKFAGIVILYADTATDQLHGAELMVFDQENFENLADVFTASFEKMGILSDVPSGRDLFEEIRSIDSEGFEGFSTKYGPEIQCEKNEESENPIYQMSLYAPGYYTLPDV